MMERRFIEEELPLADLTTALGDLEASSGDEVAGHVRTACRWESLSATRWSLSRRAAAALGAAALLTVGAVATLNTRRLQGPVTAATQHTEGLEEIFLSPSTRKQLGGLNISYSPFGQLDTAQVAANPQLEAQLQAAVGWPPATLKNAGQNCWVACGQKSGDCAWCGLGNACCRAGAKNDPPECQGAEFSTTEFHTCVAPAHPVAVKHQGQDCWEACHGSGYCEWCGSGNACCRRGFTSSDAPECAGAAGFATSERHTCVATVGSCPVGKIRDARGGCAKPETAPLMTFYMYRSMNEQNYPVNEGVNMASLGGSLWYLHNEVVISCPRKFHIIRLRRYKVTMRASKALWSSLKHNFDLFVAFDRAQCTVPDCAEVHWNKYGFVVGCVKNDPNVANYKDAVWYSLPGICPSQDFDHKTPACKAAEPGGMCREPNGQGDCTWWAEEAGEIMLNELEGISDYNAFCAAGKLEYDPLTDQGRGMSFWDGKHDALRNRHRVELVKDLFAKKYPNLPRSLGEPECDGWR